MKMWCFSAAAGWSQIEDFLSTPETDDCAEEKKLAGFSSMPTLSIGDTEGTSFCVEVYNRDFNPTNVKVPEYAFLAGVVIGGLIHYVGVATLPDLLEFLRQTVPLSISIDDWTIRKEKYVEEIEKQMKTKSRR